MGMHLLQLARTVYQSTGEKKMIYLLVMLMMLLVPSAVMYGIFTGLNNLQTSIKCDKTERNRIDRDMSYIKLFRGYK